MQQAHRKKIKRNLPELSRDLDFSTVRRFIIAEDIFPDHKIEAFGEIPDKLQQNTKFLMDILTRGPTAFGALVRSLRGASQDYLADLIDPDCEYMPPEGVSKFDSYSKPTSKYNKEDCYQMEANPRGIILIINNETFLDNETLPMREGTNLDVDNVVKLFGDKLGFLVVKKQNLKLAEMKQLYKEFQGKDHKNYDCFVSVILSHGLHDGICGVDYDKNKHEVLSIEEVVGGMDACSSLAGKPKIFFTQACRGAKIHIPSSIPMISHDSRKPTDAELKLTESMRQMSVEDNIRDQRTHVGSDVVIAYPCVKGYAAAREPDQGTWYIKSLCEELDKQCQTEHLIDILTKVNQKVGDKSGRVPSGSVVTQTSEFSSTLKKKLFFLPCPERKPVQPQQASD